MKASLDDLKGHLEKTNFNSGVESAINIIMEEEIPEAIHFITSSTTKMDKLLEGLLSLSRLSRQQMSFRKLGLFLLVVEVPDMN